MIRLLGFAKPRAGKRLRAVFDVDGVVKNVDFGDREGMTYIDHHDEVKRLNYLKRHWVREDWNDPFTPGALSAWLLWGDHMSFNDNLRDYLRRFRIKSNVLHE